MLRESIVQFSSIAYFGIPKGNELWSLGAMASAATSVIVGGQASLCRSYTPIHLKRFGRVISDPHRPFTFTGYAVSMSQTIER